nr:MAG TPA: hypothetical protein [Caudoviricetes sp.]
MKCWYCGKRLKPCQYDFVVTREGTLRPVCHDDRSCKPKSIWGGSRQKKRREEK